MRNKTILSALLIAAFAGLLGYGISQYTKTADTTATTTEEQATTAQADATDETVAAATTEATTETAAADTDATTDAATTETANAGMTPVNLDQVQLNDSTPAAGTDAAATAEDELDAPVPMSGEMTAAEKEAADAAHKKETSPVDIDVKAALVDRSLGQKSAPLTIYDYSSLTCPHCAHFHKNIFPMIKEKYIATGKVRWVFVGFPLNEPAVKAEMVARCAPQDQYEKIIDLMFQSQEKWAYEENPVANLNLIVKSAGISDDVFVSCVNNVELEKGIYAKAQEAVQKYKISSTPTFVFNDGAKTITGVGTPEGFAYDIDRFLEESKQTTPKKLDPNVYDTKK